jgi:hypothetical protein
MERCSCVVGRQQLLFKRSEPEGKESRGRRLININAASEIF